MSFLFIDLRHNLEGYLSPSYFKDLKTAHIPDRLSSAEKKHEAINTTNKYSNIIYKVRELTKHINSKDIFEHLCIHALKKLKMKNSLYTELSFSPQLYKSNNFTIKDQLNSLLTIVKKMNLNLKININFLRELGIDSAKDIYSEIKGSFDDEILFWLRSISLGGIEGTTDVQIFKKLFRNAHEDSLKTTAIAGVVPQQSKSIWESIFSIQIDRITYGHNITYDDNLLRHFRVVQTPIEISTIFLDEFLLNREKSSHLYLDFFNSGLNVVLVSDYHELVLENSDPIVLLKKIGFTNDTLEDLLVFNPIRASFLSNFERRELLDKALNLLHS